MVNFVFGCLFNDFIIINVDNLSYSSHFQIIYFIALLYYYIKGKFSYEIRNRLKYANLYSEKKIPT